MEELRSTAILDREIQDDSRRKAEKILKTCESECRQITDSVSDRIALIQAQKEAEYGKRLSLYTKDSESAIPLEKQRRLVNFIDNSVKDALDKWIEEIGKVKRLSLLEKLLEKYRIVLLNKKLKIFYIGYSEEEIKQTAFRVFGSGNIESVAELRAAKAEVEGFSDGMIVETLDRSIVCRATFAEIKLDLLSNKRQELAEALMGGRLPE